MFDVVLYQPEIAPNTGNIMRLVHNSGVRLHLVRPLGFRLSDKTLARAGLDYREAIELTVHDNWRACRSALRGAIFTFSTKGRIRYDAVRYRPGDALVFGSESRGLSEDVLSDITVEHQLYIPMRPSSRSMNLSNAAAVALYEAWRQNAFQGALTQLSGVG